MVRRSASRRRRSSRSARRRRRTRSGGGGGASTTSAISPRSPDGRGSPTPTPTRSAVAHTPRQLEAELDVMRDRLIVQTEAELSALPAPRIAAAAHLVAPPAAALRRRRRGAPFGGALKATRPSRAAADCAAGGALPARLQGSPEERERCRRRCPSECHRRGGARCIRCAAADLGGGAHARRAAAAASRRLRAGARAQPGRGAAARRAPPTPPPPLSSSTRRDGCAGVGSP